MKINKRQLSLVTAILVAIGTSACGSGNTVVANAIGTDLPDAALSSSTAAFEFVNEIVVGGSLNSDEPLEVGDMDLATNETEEPDERI